MNNITLTPDQTDAVIVSQLKTTIQDYLEDPWPHRHNLKESRQDILSFLRTLEYFLPHTEYETFLDGLDLSKLETTVEVVSSKENADGSLDLELNLDEEALKVIHNDGINFIIIKGILGVDTDEVLRLASKGKEQEEIEYQASLDDFGLR